MTTRTRQKSQLRCKSDRARSMGFAALRAATNSIRKLFRTRSAFGLGRLCRRARSCVLLRETQSHFAGGLRILIDSQVPEGKGVSSSAAIEVATMRASCRCSESTCRREAGATLPNRGEPCCRCTVRNHGSDDIGRSGANTNCSRLRCQPATIEGFVPIPKEIAFWGIDSGIRHSVAARTILRFVAARSWDIGSSPRPPAFAYEVRPAIPDRVEVDDPTWHGYLANISPSEFQSRFASVVPAEMSGREFLDRYAGTTDLVTRVDPDRNVRRPSVRRFIPSKKISVPNDFEHFFSRRSANERSMKWAN